MKSHHPRMLCQPQRRLLLENMLAVTVHHAGAEDVFAAAGSNQRAQFLFRLLLRQTMQVEKNLWRIIPPA